MSTTQKEPVAPLVEHFFRREAGRLVSVLTRIFGWRNFNLVEDMVQSTLVDALAAWRVEFSVKYRRRRRTASNKLTSAEFDFDRLWRVDKLIRGWGCHARVPGD